MDNIIQLDSRRPKSQTVVAPPTDLDGRKLAADILAGDLVHMVMEKLGEGETIDLDDPIYGILMHGVVELVRSMTNYSLDVPDITVGMLKKYDRGEISIGVIAPTVEEE